MSGVRKKEQSTYCRNCGKYTEGYNVCKECGKLK